MAIKSSIYVRSSLCRGALFWFNNTSCCLLPARALPDVDVNCLKLLLLRGKRTHGRTDKQTDDGAAAVSLSLSPSSLKMRPDDRTTDRSLARCPGCCLYVGLSVCLSVSLYIRLVFSPPKLSPQLSSLPKPS
jgi:hypothetical protein